MNSALTMWHMKRIDIYSDKKIMRKNMDLYSVLNPLTNSDSPSEKSKGLRLVSANETIKRINATYHKNTMGHNFSFIRA